ncbi:hypothetical protein HF1_12080 [Mycoplasma haemofelis str. Langford 1]|uniref:Uncharacterized protein n=1 Tax=Mycoplasma haemofelis (strain Langford 1) TaxID=941640 RepID=E8ZJ95_MYCHL|nr:hypothetical protein HF1_12080 [Mycoplasma haemofelis str. Langford 1]
MSIVRILMGIGGLSATAAGIWFGLDKKKEDDLYQVKMTKFRGTAKKINESLVQQQLGDVKVHDPEHWVWEKKFNSYVSQDWSDSRLKDIPPEIRNQK